MFYHRNYLCRPDSRFCPFTRYQKWCTRGTDRQQMGYSTNQIARILSLSAPEVRLKRASCATRISARPRHGGATHFGTERARAAGCHRVHMQPLVQARLARVSSRIFAQVQPPHERQRQVYHHRQADKQAYTSCPRCRHRGLRVVTKMSTTSAPVANEEQPVQVLVFLPSQYGRCMNTYFSAVTPKVSNVVPHTPMHSARLWRAHMQDSILAAGATVKLGNGLLSTVLASKDNWKSTDEGQSTSFW